MLSIGYASFTIFLATSMGLMPLLSSGLSCSCPFPIRFCCVLGMFSSFLVFLLARNSYTKLVGVFV